MNGTFLRKDYAQWLPISLKVIFSNVVVESKTSCVSVIKLSYRQSYIFKELDRFLLVDRYHRCLMNCDKKEKAFMVCKHYDS